MRLVTRESQFLTSLESCKRESEAAFGDDRIILEQYLRDPRHVEVHIVGDSYGNVVHLHTRDCSLQRRHQKIIEETPAPGLSDNLRERIGGMAIRAVKAVNYVNAGTVEFLLNTATTDESRYVNDADFYFCKMNTRLQVEHPVTELITGLDLVEWQLRVAAGERLPITDQDRIPLSGHAMEARVYAETPASSGGGFLPSAGRVWHHRPPTRINAGVDGDGIRVDTGLRASASGRGEGGGGGGNWNNVGRSDGGGNGRRYDEEVTVHYDPLISKIITHGPDRRTALSRLRSALRRYELSGPGTNLRFLEGCASHPDFDHDRV